MKKSYWIYNAGDYEIFHTNLVNSRRQEFGVDYPVVWKVYGVEPKVDFHADVYAEEDTTFVLHLEGKGYVFVDAWEKEFADGAMADVAKQDAPLTGDTDRACAFHFRRVSTICTSAA